MSSRDWKDDLLPASFRGVPFFVQGSSYTTGRRTNQHEFPDRSTPYAEDLGKISDGFSIEGYILGSNYFELRDRMIEALQVEGPGRLTHPYYGDRNVQAGAATFNETEREGRIVRFSVTFREAGDNRFPRGINDKNAELLESTELALVELQDDFEERYNLESLPGFALDSARSSIASAQEAFNRGTESVATVSNGIAELSFSTRNLVAETEDLLQSPSVLGSRLLDSLSLIRNATGNALDSFRSFSTMFNFGSGDEELISTTPTRETIRTNDLVFKEFIRVAASIRASEDAAVANFVSIREAQEARDSILRVINDQLESTSNDDLYQALKDIASNLVDLLPDEDSDLPQVREVSIVNTTNSLVLTYDQFDSLDNEQDIIRRNNINNPSLIGLGEIIQVLDDRRQSQS